MFSGHGSLAALGDENGPEDLPDSEYEVIKIEAAAATVPELQKRIALANGVLITSADSSNYTVAAKNAFRFSVTRRADGQIEIRERDFITPAIIAGGLLLVLVLAKR